MYVLHTQFTHINVVKRYTGGVVGGGVVVVVGLLLLYMCDRVSGDKCTDKTKNPIAFEETEEEIWIAEAFLGRFQTTSVRPYSDISSPLFPESLITYAHVNTVHLRSEILPFYALQPTAIKRARF